MAPSDKQPIYSEEFQPLTEDSLTSPISQSSSHRPPSSSSASTTSIVLENINGHSHPLKKEFSRYKDEDDPDFQAKDQFQELDIEDAPLLSNKPVDTKYRRLVWILVVACAIGWGIVLGLFIFNGSYQHRSTRAHDPDATKSAGSGRKITLDQVQAGAWIPRSESVSWISSSDGEADGLLLEKSAPNKDFLVVEDVRNWKKDSGNETMTLMQHAFFEAAKVQVQPEEVWPSPDLKTVLVLSGKERNWRHSYTGNYWLFDVETQTGQALDPGMPDSRIQLVKWSPNSDAVVFVRDNNLFLRNVNKSDKSPVVRQVTKDGGPEMFNGVPDWVYEEEVFSGNTATWWSPDGKYIAYLATNESAVPDYPLQYYVSRPSGKEPKVGLETYPETKELKYPRAGSPNPVVKLRFYDVNKGKTFDVNVDDDFADHDRLITEVLWAGKSGKILVRETNRESDMLKMVVIDATEKTSKVPRHVDINKLDGGWFEVSETTTFLPKDPANGRLRDGYIDTVIHEGYNHLAYFRLTSGKPHMITAGPWEVVDAPSAVDLKNNWVYFIGTKESSIQRHLYRVKLNGEELQPVTDVSNKGYYDVNFSKKAGYALMSYKGPDVPWQKIVSTPSLDGHFQHTLENNTALSQMAAAHEMPLRQYSTVNISGYELNVMELRPPHFNPKRSYPVLFHLYGGPGSQTVDRQFAVNFQSYVASSLGYIVVTVDGRGTGYIGRKARVAVRDNIGKYEATDQIETAKIWAAKPYVDAKRIAIWGWSYGGFLTLKTLEQDAGRTFRYGMAVAPVTDWRFYDSIYTERWMHTPKNNPTGYANSTITNTTSLGANVRFLVMHGTGDDNVHIQNTLTLLDNLDVKGVENYDVHVFPDSDHSIYFHNANRAVFDKLSWWLINAFNGEWERVRNVKPIGRVDKTKRNGVEESLEGKKVGRRKSEDFLEKLGRLRKREREREREQYG
ncbi:MAG: hypothetical protein M1831_000611 [Alyxoria varia]|nr:MAG: hypothetical protein M1831_000611 [Alyxoria varia]